MFRLPLSELMGELEQLTASKRLGNKNEAGTETILNSASMSH
jgi:hypothetical protein